MDKNLGMLQQDDIQELINQMYEIGEYVGHDLYSHGYTNENFKVQTKKNIYFLRLCKVSTKQDVQKEIILMQKLKEVQFKTAYPIADKKGEFIHELKGFPVVLFDFIQNGKNIELSEKAVKQIAEQIQLLQKIDLTAEIKKKNQYSIENCFQIISQYQKYKPLHPEYEDIFNYFEEYSNFIKPYLQKNLPFGVTHGDVYPDNTIFDENSNLLAIIDFDEFSSDFYLYDLAQIINGFCFVNNEIDQNLLNQALNSYQIERKLVDEEINSLNVFILWGAHAMIWFHFNSLLNIKKNERQEKRLRELIQRNIKFRKFCGF